MVQENIEGGPEKGWAEGLLHRNLAQLKAFGMVTKTHFTNSINYVQITGIYNNHKNITCNNTSSRV